MFNLYIFFNNNYNENRRLNNESGNIVTRKNKNINWKMKWIIRKKKIKYINTIIEI